MPVIGNAELHGLFLSAKAFTHLSHHQSWPATFACGKKTYCFTSSFTTQNKIKNLPFVSSTTLIWTHKQVTGLDRSYTTKVAAAKILGLLYQVRSEGFGKSPSEYDDSPVGFSMPHFGQTCVHSLIHHPAGWEKENIRKPCDLHFALQSLQSTANIYMR
jgi:hypothetical protein